MLPDKKLFTNFLHDEFRMTNVNEREDMNLINSDAFPEFLLIIWELFAYDMHHITILSATSLSLWYHVISTERKFFFSWMENCFKLFLFAFGVTQINSEIFSVLSTSEMGKISLLREKKPFSDQNFRVFWHIMMQTRIDILIHFISENIASRGWRLTWFGYANQITISIITQY